MYLSLISCHFSIALLFARPDLVEFEALKPGEHISNLNNAFDLAQSHLGIARLLDAEGAAIKIYSYFFVY